MLKLLLLFAHLIGTSVALGTIVATDLGLLTTLATRSRSRVGRGARVEPPSPFLVRLIVAALLLLIASGAALVALGLDADPHYLANPKLRAKLILVAVLAGNAVALHRRTFPRLARAPRLAQWRPADIVRVAAPVALSNSLWMFCAFLGIARPWNFQVSIGFVLGTAAWLFGAAFIGVATTLAVGARRGAMEAHRPGTVRLHHAVRAEPAAEAPRRRAAAA